MTGRKRYLAPPIDDDFDDMSDAEMAGFREGQMAALDGMDLPDGAYFAMADDMGIDLGDFVND